MDIIECINFHVGCCDIFVIFVAQSKVINN